MSRLAIQNPYQTSSAVFGEEFYNRRSLLEDAEEELLNSQRGGIILFLGQRRIGKTSVLLELERRLKISGQPATYVPLEGFATLPFGRVLKDIAKRICSVIELSRDPSQYEFDDEGLVFRREFLLPALERVRNNHQRLCLLFDEFEDLDVAQKKMLPENTTARRFAIEFRRWFDEENYASGKLSYAFALGRSAIDIDENQGLYARLLKSALRLIVTVMSSDETRELLTDLAKGRLRYSDEAIDSIYNLTYGHPMLTQLLGKLVYTNAYRRQSNDKNHPYVEVLDVDRQIPELLSKSADVFDWIWEGLQASEHIYLSVLAHVQTTNKTLVSSSQMDEAFKARIPSLPRIQSDLRKAHKKLTDLKMIEGTDSTGYRMQVPLIWQWVVQNWPPEAVKNEADKVDANLLALYELSEQAITEGHLDQALNYLDRILRQNPYHYQARIKRGQTYLQLQQYDEAVSDFEEAYRREPTDASSDLIVALEQRASDTANEDQKISDYTRILQLYSGHTEAEKRRDEAISRRLHILEESGQFLESIDLLLQYPQFDFPDTRIRLLVGLAQQYEERKDWEAASDIYQKLDSLDVKRSVEWQDKRNLVENLKNLADMTRSVQDSIARASWIPAMHQALAILELDPTFVLDKTKAVDLMIQAARGFSNQVKSQIAPKEEDKRKSTRLPRVWREWQNLVCNDLKDGFPFCVSGDVSIGKVMFMRAAAKARFCLVTDTGSLDGRLLSIVTDRDLSSVLTGNPQDADKVIGSIRTLYEDVPERHQVSLTDSIRAALELLANPAQVHGRSRSAFVAVVAVLNRERRLVGTISYLDILRAIRDKRLPLPDAQIEHYMRVPSDEHRVHSKTPISHAHSVFVKQNLPALVVEADTDRKFLGLITDEDILRVYQYAKIDAATDLVVGDKRFLTRVEDIDRLTPEDSLKDTLVAFLRSPNPQTLPVVKNGHCKGLFSYFDLLRAVLTLSDQAVSESK